MDRRKFLASAALTAASASSALGANDRIRLALIGCGGRGRAVARQMVRNPNVEYATLCDAYLPQAREANRELSGGAGKIEQDFRRVLEDPAIDAVHIATPDHWHAIPAVLALQAGKHVYCEKPLGHNVVEGRAIVNEASRHPGQVFLTGTQHRSAPHLMEVERMVREGVLGDVHFVKVWNYANLTPGGLAETPDEEPPAELDWDLYLGPAPAVPFNRARFLRSYRGFFDYAGGWITDYGVHRFDTVHQIMGQDAPRAVTASGGRFAVGGVSDQPDVLQATYEYPGFVLSYEAINTNSFGSFARTAKERTMHGAHGLFDRPNGMAFYGSNGLVVADRLGYEVYPEGERGGSALGSGSTAAPALAYRAVNGEEPTGLHAAHFVRCVREGEKPRTGALTGHRSSLIAHLGNVAFKTGRKLWWDAEREECVSDSEASLRLGRKARPPWDLITL
ncbi:MAG: Gfo/Idh/MocA family oxidoreductase [Acidobacteria bacterium]|nr:Gfo/Idh/MocA family oxidoreductase [Acidobacteriota bacterium]